MRRRRKRETERDWRRRRSWSEGGPNREVRRWRQIVGLPTAVLSRNRAVAKDTPVGRQGLDRVKNGIKDVYLVCGNIMSAPKKIKMVMHDHVVPAQCGSVSDSECVNEAVSVLQEMQQIAHYLRGLLFSDANKLSRFVADKILAQTSKYELIINKVNLQNERLRGRAEVQKRLCEKLLTVSDNLNTIGENVCRVSDVCEDLSARPAYVPGAASQGSGSASQPRSYAVIVRGADKQLTTVEVRRRMDEAMCSEVDVRVRAVRPARGRGIVIDTPSDQDRKSLTTCPVMPD